jgi:DNA-binding IclR family transcriptional regulator
MQKLHKDHPRLSVLGKVLGVLEAVTDHPQGVGLPDLAARLSLSRQTVHRVLGQLEHSGLLVRDPVRERFSIGPRLARLSLAALASHNGLAAIRETMQEVVDDIGETCNIGVLDGLEYVYLERIQCEWPLRLHIEVGTRAPAYCLAGGKVLLAHLEPKLCARLIRSRKLVARTARSIANPGDLEAEFDRVRGRGYALSNEENFEGIVAVAVPIRNALEAVVAALTVHGPLPRFDIERCEKILPRLRDAAQRIAHGWGLT